MIYAAGTGNGAVIPHPFTASTADVGSIASPPNG